MRYVGRGVAAVTVPASALTAGPAHAVAKPRVTVAVTPAMAKVGSVAVVSGTDPSHKAAVSLALQRLVGHR